MLTHFLSKFLVLENDTNSVAEKIKYLVKIPGKAHELGLMREGSPSRSIRWKLGTK